MPTPLETMIADRDRALLGTPLEYAIACRDQAVKNLLDLELAGPQTWVDYSTTGPNGEGHSYQFAQAKKQLLDSIDKYTDLIQKLQPFLLRSRGR